MLSVAVTHTNQLNEYNATSCCICHETLDNQINVLTSCKHIIHNNCFQKWIRVDQSCPICRNLS